MRTFRTFVHKEASLRIASDRFEAAAADIVRQRAILDQYISRHPNFLTSLVPVEPLPDAPDIVREMCRAGRRAGVGPMAAVAGAMAQRAADAAGAAGAREAIVDNGGDIFLRAAHPICVGLYTGTAAVADQLAFAVNPSETPLAICSSSGRMGHSLSMGTCDLATVVARDAALADAAATRAGNLVHTPDDLQRTLETIMAIAGVDGVLLVKDNRIGMAGKLPELVRNPLPIPHSVGLNIHPDG